MSRLVSAVVLLALVALAVGCVTVGDAAPELPLLQDPTPMPDRSDCGEIQGTVFRSNDERSWYEENCNQWPPVSVPQSPARTSGSRPASSEPSECAAIRGKPYESNDQRRWYLDNCMGNQNRSSNPNPSQPQQGDRTNCDEIRGTPYRSGSEREWYRNNCPSVPSGGSGPDRTDCNEIRGTSYRSAPEREWFQRNCPPGQR